MEASQGYMDLFELCLVEVEHGGAFGQVDPGTLQEGTEMNEEFKLGQFATGKPDMLIGNAQGFTDGLFGQEDLEALRASKASSICSFTLLM